MFSLTPIVIFLAGLTSVTAAPALQKRTSQLSCVTYQYGGPFTASGANGFVHLYANVTSYDSKTQTTSFNETRLGLVDGTIQPCGDCRTTEQFGFEVCQGPDRNGYKGLGNSPQSFFGHLLYRNVDSPRCVSSSRSAGSLDGVSLNVRDCSYDYDTVNTNGQYWKMTVGSDGVWSARLQYENLFADEPAYYGETYGPSLDGKTLQEDVGDASSDYGFKQPF